MPIKSKRKTSPKQEADTKKAAEELSTGETEGLSPEALVLYATLETGFLAACADGELDQEEYDTLGASFNTWTGADLDAEALQKLFEVFIGLLEEEGLEVCIARAASQLDEEQRRSAFDFAAAITIVSGDTSEDEIEGLQFIAAAFEIPDEEARDRWIAVSEALAD